MKDLNCFIDLHIHLDGAISLESSKKLAKLQGIDIPKNDEELLKLIRVSEDCKDLNEFLEKFAFPCLLLQTKEGIKGAILNLLNEQKEKGVIYTEIRFAPQLSCEKGLSLEEVVSSACEALKDSPIPANLILCTMRGADKEDNLKTVRAAQKFLGKGVVCIDLAGAEALFPNEDYAYVFEEFKKHDVPFVIHSGEADGPKSIRSALSFEPKRIGHGVRAIEDEELLKILSEKKIPLELCPTSNICTCIFNDIKDYPIKRFIDCGIVCTINTDDPAIEGTDIRKEFEMLIENFNLNDEEVKELLKNAVHASFASEEIKHMLLNKIDLTA